MDIHAPEHPIHSWREFGVHIAVVTVGILIAIALEGVREAVVTHHLVAETRESVRDEESGNLQNMKLERSRIEAGNGRLQALVAQLPAMALQHPEQVSTVLAQVKNPYYFFAANSWQAALSTGALAHMHPAEAEAYAWAAQGTAIYSQWQQRTMDAQSRAEAFWQAHPQVNAEQAASGIELLRLYASEEETLAYLAPQTESAFQRAYSAAGGR